MERTFISTGERIRNYLGVGLLLSLLLNAFVTPLYPDLTTSNTYVRPDVFSVSHTTRVSTPLPKPTPPPTHRMTPRAQAAAKPFAATPPKTHGTSGPAEPAYVPPANAVPGGIPGSDGTAPTSDATTGTATTGPSCSVSVLVQVTINAQGRLLDAKIYQSSNNAAIDQSALRAARQTTYAPRIANCAPVEPIYSTRTSRRTDVIRRVRQDRRACRPQSPVRRDRRVSPTRR